MNAQNKQSEILLNLYLGIRETSVEIGRVKENRDCYPDHMLSVLLKVREYMTDAYKKTTTDTEALDKLIEFYN